MKMCIAYKGLMLFYVLTGISGAISVGFTSGGTGGQSSIGSNYDLDNSAGLTEIATLGDGLVSSVGIVEGSGNNRISKTAANNGASVSSSLASNGAISALTSGHASGNSVDLGQNVYAQGQSDIGVSGSSDAHQANQEAGVLNGAMVSSQTVSAESGTVSAVQTSSIAGSLGYSNGQARSSDNTIKVTGGLNGAGIMQGIIATIAADSAAASGSINAESEDSKAYSAVKSISADGEVYSYLSSNDRLASGLSAHADGHVTADQNLNAKGDARIYTSSASEDSSSKTYSATGEAVSGRISASAGSPATIESNLQGDIQSAADGVIPTPGTWVWNGFGGYLTSNPFQLKDAQGNSHTFSKGGDNALWDNNNGDWQRLGGVITSDPFAVSDSGGKTHVFVRGSDGSLWDRILGGSWTGLGGYITSNPSAALAPDGHIKIAAKGGDNSLWVKDLSGAWSSLGGVVTSNPEVIFDKDGKLHALVRGNDGSLWDNAGGTWKALGGYITSDAKPILNPFEPGYIYTFARGGDGSLWSNRLDTSSNTATWTGLGGFMSASSGIRKGDAAPMVDTDGVIHTFVRGGDGALWDNANGHWYALGGAIASDPNAIRDRNGRLRVAALGSNSGLWTNTLGLDRVPTALVGKLDCDYNKIQSAVDASVSGATIKVLSGTYHENVKVTKNLDFIGVDTSGGKPVVDGNNVDSVFVIGTVVNGGTKASISNMKIQNGNALQWKMGGGILNIGELTLKDNEITGNTANYGGGVLNEDGARLTIISGSIHDNNALYGGGVYNGDLDINNPGIVNINGGSIDHNHVTGCGGGVFNLYGTTNLNGGSILYNTADDYGAGFANQQGTSNLNGGNIDYNYASKVGGGVYNVNGIVNLMGSSIDYNSAVQYGGGIHSAGGTLNLNGGSINGNDATFGGGVYSDKTLNLAGASVTYNKADYGGGIFNNGAASLTSGSIAQNTANILGGGIYNKGIITPTAGVVHDNKPTDIET